MRYGFLAKVITKSNQRVRFLDHLVHILVKFIAAVGHGSRITRARF